MTKEYKSSQKTKEKILQGAKQFLLKHGILGFTIRSVANEAGVNQGLVHHYFGSKENLVLELIDAVVVEPFNLAKKLTLGKKKEEIKNVILDVLLQNSELMGLLIEFVYFAQHSPTIREKIKQVMKERREFITNALGIDNEDDKYTFNAGIFGIIFISRIDEKVNIETSIKRLFERFDLLK